MLNEILYKQWALAPPSGVDLEDIQINKCTHPTHDCCMEQSKAICLFLDLKTQKQSEL